MLRVTLTKQEGYGVNALCYRIFLGEHVSGIVVRGIVVYLYRGMREVFGSNYIPTR